MSTLYTGPVVECPVEGCEATQFIDHGGGTTLLGWQPHFDDEGVYHSHNPNMRTLKLECQNKHWFRVSGKNPCPVKACAYGGLDIVKEPQ